MTSRCRNPIHCIVPPYVLDSIARNGTQEQRAWVLDTLARDHSLRAARAENRHRRGLRGPAEGADILATVAPAGPDRVIRDAQHREEVSVGPIVRREGDGPTGDHATDEAYDHLGDTYRYYDEIHDRQSIDDAGMPLRAVVHFGNDYDNAFWDGKRMVFGDGDGSLFLRFTVSLDVIAHELSHGVTEFESGLEYWGQAGALNESLSDVFGVLAKQYKLGQTADQADWLVGADLVGPDFHGRAFRDMARPGTAYDDPLLGSDPQPGHWGDYVRTFEDNGGVHINSGIPNRAFVVLAKALGGKAWEKAGLIWYEAATDARLPRSSTMRQFAKLTHRAARRLHGPAGGEADAVRDAWNQVGIHWA